MFWPNSSRVIEYDKRQKKNLYKGPQGNLKINVEVSRSFL